MSKVRILALLQKADECAQRLDKAGWRQHLDAALEDIDALERTGEDVRALRGEQLLVSAFQHRTDFDAYLRTLEEAAALIDGRSTVLPRRCPMFHGFYSAFSVVNGKPGRAMRNADLLDRAEELFFQLTSGGRGTAASYRAQMAFYRSDFEQARTYGLRALDDAQANGQELVALCAAEVLANASKHLQDLSLWSFARESIRTRIGNETAGDACCKLAQVLDCTLDLSVGLLPEAPAWLREGDFGAVPAEWGFQEVEGTVPAPIVHVALLARVQYLLYRSRRTMALSALGVMGDVYGQRSLVLDAYDGFFSANAYHYLGDASRERAALRKGVEAVGPDGLWVIAAEFADLFGDVLYDEVARFDPVAVAEVRRIGEGYWEKLRPLREEVLGQAPGRLSSREHQVAKLAVQGKTNAEIAEELHISVRTVRYHLESIYHKCHVNRRTQLAEALRNANVETADWAHEPRR